MIILKVILFLLPILLAFNPQATDSSFNSPGDRDTQGKPLDSVSINKLIITSDDDVTPSTTVIINLPIVEQNVSFETPSPDLNNSVSIENIILETSTPTPTPIPQQTGYTNLPIVIGAVAIIVVVLLAWFFVSYLPGRKE